VITPTQDEDSSPYLIYDVDDVEDVTIPQHDDEIKKRPLAWKELLNTLLVKEENIVQVLMRAYNAHKFIEDLMWKT
jgi:hypothetical protein